MTNRQALYSNNAAEPATVVVPHGWSQAKLAFPIRDIVSGDWGTADSAAYPDNVPCYVIRGTDFSSVRTGQFGQVPRRFLRSSSLRLRQLQPDDLLIETSGGSDRQPTGRILRVTPETLAEARLPVTFTNFLKLVRVDRGIVDPAFFELYWGYLYELGRTRVYEKRTTGIRNFKYREYLEQEPVWLPPLPEQRAIAHVLSTVQRAREATEAVIAAARELKRSLMRHLFTYGPVPPAEAERVLLKESEVGPVPEHWSAVTVRDILASGPQNGIYKPQSLYGEGTAIVRISDFGNDGDIVSCASNRVRLSKEEVEHYELRPDDILLNRVNSLSHLGKVALIGTLAEPMVYESNMMRFRVDPDIALPEYVFRFLTLPSTRDQLRAKAKLAVAQSSVNQDDVRSAAMALPPLAEQAELCSMLSGVDRKIEAEEKRRAALEQLFRSLLQQLMTGQVRLDPTAILKEVE